MAAVTLLDVEISAVGAGGRAHPSPPPGAPLVQAAATLTCVQEIASLLRQSANWHFPALGAIHSRSPASRAAERLGETLQVSCRCFRNFQNWRER